MARFRHTVALEPVPRPWFEQAVGLCFDTLTDYLAGIGDEPGPQARYELPDEVTSLHLESWRRDGETEGRTYAVTGGTMSILTVRVDSPGNPRAVDVAADVRGVERGVGWLTAMSGSAHVDLPTWWDGTARTGVGPAITGQGRHALVHGAGSVAVAPARDGRWQVTVRMALRGRGLLRPLGSAAFLFARAKVRREFTRAVTEFARRWNEEVPALLTRQRDEVRALITEELTGAAPHGR
jgi:hypothetical protein